MVPRFKHFSWGYLKEKVFKHHPLTLEELKERIIEEVNTTPLICAKKLQKNFRVCVQQCVVANSRHLEWQMVSIAEFKN